MFVLVVRHLLTVMLTERNVLNKNAYKYLFIYINCYINEEVKMISEKFCSFCGSIGDYETFPVK